MANLTAITVITLVNKISEIVKIYFNQWINFQGGTSGKQLG